MRSQAKSMRIGQQKQHVHFKTCLFRQAARTASEAATKAFLLQQDAIKDVAKNVQKSIEPVEDVANTAYRLNRSSREAAFREELTGRVFERRDALHRMQEFWAYKGVAYLEFKRSTKELYTLEDGWVVGRSPDRDRVPENCPSDLNQSQPITFAWKRGDGRAQPRDPWMQWIRSEERRVG